MDKDETYVLSDGEIEDYTPLQRPELAVTKPENPVLHYSDSDEKSCSDSDDSDSPTSCKRSKPRRSKYETEKMQEDRGFAKRRRFNIWCSEVQADTLTNELENFDVTKTIDRSRSVESYDYTIAQKLRGEEGCNQEIESSLPEFTDVRESQFGENVESGNDYRVGQNNKRKFHERGSVKSRLGRRPIKTEDDIKASPRYLLDLKVNVMDSCEDVATDIANKLYELKEDLILRAVQVIGNQKAIDLYMQTKNIEENGGMMIMNGTRRRTPGGVYLFLMKSDDEIPQEKKQLIFIDDRRDFSSKKKYEAALSRKKKTEELRRRLSEDGLLRERELPPLMTRGDLAVQEMGNGHIEDAEELDGESTVTNPPPSPATDGRDNSSDGVPEVAPRQLTQYECDDDFLDVACDNMDVF